MNIVECPICESRFDISKVPDGTKLKCSTCKKIFGLVQGGELTPFLEEESPVLVEKAPIPQAALLPPEAEVLESEEEYEEAVATQPSYREQVLAKPVEKPGFLLVLGGLAGLAAMGTLAYTLYDISRSLPPYIPKSELRRKFPSVVEPSQEEKDFEKPSEVKEKPVEEKKSSKE